MDAKQVAYYIIKLAARESEPELITPMRLQKLLYYVQGWHLGLTGVPVFAEPIEAWRFGPVVRSIYQEFKKYDNQQIPPSMVSDATELSASMQHFINSIWQSYKKYSAIALKEKTHRESPWVDAHQGYGPAELCNEEITLQAMRDYFQAQYEHEHLEGLDLQRVSRMLSPMRAMRGESLETILGEAGFSNDYSTD